MAADKQTPLAPLSYFHKEVWSAANGSQPDTKSYTMSYAQVGVVITNEKYIELSNLISQEALRRGPHSSSAPISPSDGDTIRATDHGQMAEALNNLKQQVVIGPAGTPYRGNGHSTLPRYPASGWPNSTTKVPGIIPGAAPITTFGAAQIGNLILADVITNSASFNKLIDSVIFAGQQCWCNCNYCACNCNYCTCNCNFACTCNCNYSDEKTKENIEYL